MRTYKGNEPWVPEWADEPAEPRLEKAKNILKHYFRELAEWSRQDWSGYNDDEIDQAVDLIAESLKGG